MAKIQYVIPDGRKELAEQILEAQGLTPQVAINMLYIEVINNGGLPFYSSKIEVPNYLTAKTIRDADKGVDLIEVENVDDMFDKLNDE